MLGRRWGGEGVGWEGGRDTEGVGYGGVRWEMVEEDGGWVSCGGVERGWVRKGVKLRRKPR